MLNGISIQLGPVRSLALRLAQQHDAGADAAAARLDDLLEQGGERNLVGFEAAAVLAALQSWLDETNETVLGAPLLALRDRLAGETQRA